MSDVWAWHESRRSRNSGDRVPEIARLQRFGNLEVYCLLSFSHGCRQRSSASCSLSEKHLKCPSWPESSSHASRQTIFYDPALNYAGHTGPTLNVNSHVKHRKPNMADVQKQYQQLIRLEPFSKTNGSDSETGAETCIPKLGFCNLDSETGILKLVFWNWRVRFCNWCSKTEIPTHHPTPVFAFCLDAWGLCLLLELLRNPGCGIPTVAESQLRNPSQFIPYHT